MSKAIQPVSPKPRRWKTLVAAFSLAALLGTPLVAVAAENAPANGTQSADAAAAEAAQEAASRAAEEVANEAAAQEEAREGVVSFTLGSGSNDYTRAQQVVSGLNEHRGSAGALELDASLQKAAMQRAAEYSLWLSETRPNGEDIAKLIASPSTSESNLMAVSNDDQSSDIVLPGTGGDDSPSDQPQEGDDQDGSTEGDESQDQPTAPTGITVMLFNDDNLEPATVVERAAQSQAQTLANSGFKSVGVGCWYQGTHRFYAVLLSPDAATGDQARTTGVESVTPVVEVDMSGATSKVLQSRLKVDGYETTLNLPEGGTRAVTFSWVTAPEESDLATAQNLPSIALDPSSFTWTSSNPNAVSVSDTGVVTMRAPSTTTAATSSTVTATLKGSNRALTMQVTGSVPLYRLYNPYSGEHLYTTDPNEYASLGASGWNQEGIYWESPWSPASLVTATPVYRLYNPYNGDHHYTASKTEYDALAAQGWEQEGTKFYSEDESNGEPIYRLYNPWLNGTHLYTPDAGEYHDNVANGWTGEDEAFFGVIH